MPKLSIITINFNNLNGLKKTVETVINQTWQEFEYIVIDGGSTDGSAEYIKSQSEHFDYWVCEPDKGIFNAMNKGIIKATGDYLLFLNSGDHFFNIDVLKQSSSSFKTFDLIYFDVNMIKGNRSWIVKHSEQLHFSYFYLNGLNHQSVLIKKTLFDVVGLYDENLKIASDWKFFILALFKHDCSYINLKTTLSTYYVDGISYKFNENLLKERNLVLQEYFGAFVQDYEQWNNQRLLLDMNRYRMLSEIEKSFIGRKIVSFFLRIMIVLCSKKSLKKILS